MQQAAKDVLESAEKQDGLLAIAWEHYGMFTSYQNYLESEHWQETRKKALKAANYQCQLNSKHTGPLIVHHRTYERVGRECLEDLTVLCRDCNDKHHDKGPKNA